MCEIVRTDLTKRRLTRSTLKMCFLNKGHIGQEESNVAGPWLNSPEKWGFKGIKEKKRCRWVTERKDSRQSSVRLVATGNWWLLLDFPVAVIWEDRERAAAQSSPRGMERRREKRTCWKPTHWSLNHPRKDEHRLSGNLGPTWWRARPGLEHPRSEPIRTADGREQRRGQDHPVGRD